MQTLTLTIGPLVTLVTPVRVTLGGEAGWRAERAQGKPGEQLESLATAHGDLLDHMAVDRQ